MTSHLIAGASSGGSNVWLAVFNKRTMLAVTSGIGIGLTIAYAFRSYFIREEKSLEKSFIEPSYLEAEPSTPFIQTPRQEGRSQSVRTRASSDDRSTRLSLRQKSTSFNPIEADIFNGYGACLELRRTLERVLENMEMVKNRSDKDMSRALKTEAIIQKLKDIEEDFAGLQHSGDIAEEVFAMKPSDSFHTLPTRTLSVLSDGSFMSAFEDFPPGIDDVEFETDASFLDNEQLVLLKEGYQAAANGDVKYRKSRAETCQCETETEFAAKLFGIRLAMERTFEDEHKRLWLWNCGRTMLADYIRHTKQDPLPFIRAFEGMQEWFKDPLHFDVFKDEVFSRGVESTSFYDVVLDFILFDSFEDLRSPPSAIYSVTRNVFLSQSMKYSTLNTVIWSMLKAKRQRLKVAHGFIAHFYNISEALMPAIILGFLGTDDRLGELCHYFKDQILQFALDIFNTQKVRYSNVEELSEDIWIVMRNRIEAIQTQMSSRIEVACPLQIPKWYSTTLSSIGCISFFVNSLGLYFLVFKSRTRTAYRYTLLYVQVG
ncbi:unnamed protein product [Caenorhabditis auriculariae]|uniref:Uncharacterized protein n=1 Tax=Caenorhabditis auriculariae TaxID=2777116 RepID=A0A8S1GRL0_9PELO|nr:unnamed protein product [Caenorhabditis auriculariae]